jgi:hypothetical protein
MNKQPCTNRTEPSTPTPEGGTPRSPLTSFIAQSHDDLESIIEAIASRVVAKLIGSAEPTSNNGLKPYNALEYYSAIREARTGNGKPLREYLKYYQPKPL